MFYWLVHLLVTNPAPLSGSSLHRAESVIGRILLVADVLEVRQAIGVLLVDPLQIDRVHRLDRLGSLHRIGRSQELVGSNTTGRSHRWPGRNQSLVLGVVVLRYGWEIEVAVLRFNSVGMLAFRYDFELVLLWLLIELIQKVDSRVHGA